ncbi:hypothetical protein GCM10027594_35980 [Hymenobacter agri]
MPSIVVPITAEHAPAFRELLQLTDLVDLVAETSRTTAQGPVVLFTLEAGPGAGINYFFLGKAWADALLVKGGVDGAH